MATQEFLDGMQYTRNKILLYERIFGPNSMSTGGEDVVQDMCAKLKLSPGQKVLDVGCGIGGNSFYLAHKYGVLVLGIDISTNMLAIAAERLQKYDSIKNLIHFQPCDITKHEFQEASFDAIFSKDAILHIKDKENVFRKFLKWLKPGGQLLIGDPAKGEGELSEVFCQYVKARDYHLLTVKDYAKLLEKVGFKKVLVEDQTEFFVDLLQKDLEKLQELKEEIIQDFSEDDYNFILNGWKAKLAFKGSHAWGLYLMQKPII